MKKIVAMFAVCNNVPITNEIKLIIINHESLQNVVPDMLSVHVWQISILEALSCLTRASPNSLWTWLWAEVPACRNTDCSRVKARG